MLVPYSIGRKDCDSSQGMPKRNLPGHTLLDGVSYLKDAFDLNTKEAVALLGKYMGMHSLSCLYAKLLCGAIKVVIYILGDVTKLPLFCLLGYIDCIDSVTYTVHVCTLVVRTIPIYWSFLGWGKTNR